MKVTNFCTILGKKFNPNIHADLDLHTFFRMTHISTFLFNMVGFDTKFKTPKLTTKIC